MCDTDASQQNPSPLDENEEWEKVRICINTSSFKNKNRVLTHTL